MKSEGVQGKPVLDDSTLIIPKIWTDPITGIKIPKLNVSEHLTWRKQLLVEARNDTGLQSELLAACRESILLWINSFLFTYHQFDVDDAGKRKQADYADVPFITWPIQDKYFMFLEDHLKNGKDAGVKKSRDMGASWAALVFMLHKWLFRPDSQMLMMSRTREYVDQVGNMKALFQKVDYAIQFLPDWMCPPGCHPGEEHRTSMHLKNVLNNSVLSGESTTEFAASGDRRLIILLDEFAKVKYGAAMRSATRDAALMRIVNSTPAGAGTEYSRWISDGTLDVFPLMWWDHPDKGKGRKVIQDPSTSEWKITGPWYQSEESVRSPREMAQEIDAEDLASGSTFFTVANFDKHQHLFGRPPKYRLNISFRPSVTEDKIPDIILQRRYNNDTIWTTPSSSGKLSVWCDLVGGRPDQTKTYRFGIDLGKGQGASPSVVSILCEQTGRKIAEWYDNRTPPYEMAPIVAALALWCGGSLPHRHPFLVWEMNGPGWDFSRVLVHTLQYPNFYRQIKKGKITETPGKTYGVHMDQDTKKRILYAYDRCIASGKYINPSIRALQQARLYIHYDSGGCGPAELSDSGTEERKEHGDIVIADALSIDFDKAAKIKVDPQDAPARSFAARKAEHLRKTRKTKDKSWRKVFDYG